MPFFVKDQSEVLSLLYPTNFSEYELMLRSLGDMLEREILPLAEKIDKEKIFPRENLCKLFDLDVTAMTFPERYGGLELPSPVYAAAIELAGKACASTAISIAIHGTVCQGVQLFGSEEQKENYLTPMLKGRKLGSFALTEPNAGSDAKSMRTRATYKDGKYAISGSKMFITNAGEADVYFVFAKTDKGPSAFLVDKTASGVVPMKNMDKLGLRGSRLMEVYLKDCEVPKDNLVGEEGEGFEYAKRMLAGGRITVAAISTGIAQIAYEKTVRYSTQRIQFGQAISSFEMIREKLADMATGIRAARLMTYFASAQKDRGIDFGASAASAKLFASEASVRICDEAIQIHGGYGYVDETDVHRHWRDARLMTIGEGTSEIMRLIISKEVADRYSSEPPPR